MEEKWAVRAQLVLDLAQRHGYQLDPSAVYCEQGSGASLASRPVLCDLLARARAREYDVLITPYQDRLSRGDRHDEQDIEDALIRGRIVVVTTEGVTDYGAESYDPTMYEVRSFVGRAELRAYARRRRETNRAKARLGHRYCGFAPYGYVWLPAQFDRLAGTTTAGRYEVVPAEWDTLREIWARAVTESIPRIAATLNARLREHGAPLPPGHGRRSDASPEWRTSALHRILSNPFYCGYPSQRSRIIHRERRTLARAEWVSPEVEQDYPHPVTPAEWERVQRAMTARDTYQQARSNATRHGTYLLTGLLWCSAGHRMHGAGQAYTCDCEARGDRHPGRYLAVARADAAVVGLLRGLLAAIPADLLPPPATDRSALEVDYKAARRALAQAEATVTDMQQHAGVLIRSWGEEAYEQAAAKARAELDAAAARLEELSARIAAPDLRDVLSVVEAWRAVGFDAVWAAGTPEERRTVVRQFLRRVEVVPPERPRQHTRALRAVPHAEVAAYVAEDVLPLG